ncbi:MAG: hypothetical protein ACFHVJ_12190 [Aestuariibacter sp.]
MAQVANQSLSTKILGEWSWSRNILWLISMLCLADALYVSGTDYQMFIRDGAFHSALLIGMAGYLSEMRYRWFKDQRADPQRAHDD